MSNPSGMPTTSPNKICGSVIGLISSDVWTFGLRGKRRETPADLDVDDIIGPYVNFKHHELNF